MNTSRLTGAMLGVATLILLVGCDKVPEAQSTAGEVDVVMTEGLTVYKLPSCGCCQEWMAHLEEEGIETRAREAEDMNAVKDRYQIAPAYQSCHTAVSQQGYVFEGHIPARYIQAFLANPPEGAIGLAVPGMPLGSPGMEVGDRFTPYEVLLLKDDGTSEVFASIASVDQQGR